MSENFFTGFTIKVPENVGEAISFPHTFNVVRREDTILPYIDTGFLFMVVPLFSMVIYV